MLCSCASFLTAAVSQIAREGRDVAQPTTSAGQSKPSSASQQHGRDLCKYPSVNQTFKKAAAAQPTGLQSQQPQQQWSAMQSETGAQSEEEEDFEEREDDRANDPACIQCDDGGALLPTEDSSNFSDFALPSHLTCSI